MASEFVKCQIDRLLEEAGEGISRLNWQVVRQHDKFIPIHSVRLLSGIRKGQSKTAGLWPWLERHAGVIEREEGQGGYRIKNEFYDAMKQVFR